MSLKRILFCLIINIFCLPLFWLTNSYAAEQNQKPIKPEARRVFEESYRKKSPPTKTYVPKYKKTSDPIGEDPFDQEAGIRTRKWSGFDLAVGMPFPAVFGAMMGFNIKDDARISVGWGAFSHWNNYQLDLKVFLSSSALAMYIGAGMDYMVGKRTKVWLWDFQFDRAFIPYIELGLDYQTEMGFHMTFNAAGSAPNGKIIALPGIGVGWYF